MIKFDVKIDVLKTVKRSSRIVFEGMDTRSRVVKDKTKYDRKRNKKSLDTW
jgi:hypothetical protein